MEGNAFKKIIVSIKNKVLKKREKIFFDEEVAFSLEEVDSISKENIQKIQELKKDFIKKNKGELDKVELGNNITEVLNKINNYDNAKKEEITKNDNIENDKVNEIVVSEEFDIQKKDDNIENKVANLEIEEHQGELNQENRSFINLPKDLEDKIMTSWNDIDLQQIDKDIIEGKDILNHNYNITYGDDAARYVHNIRKRYEVVISYLIGFNNEKNGLFDKIIFSDKIDNEWKYLDSYIKLLEKIRSFRK